MTLDRRLSIAPMMGYTDRHMRYLLRLISSRVLLYTEMVTTQALLHGDPVRHLARHQAEQPVALQLGGCEPAALAQCARMAEAAGYDEVNLNVGCPSDRVQAGRFGACLMAEPQLVADCVAAMKDAVSIPVTVKTRIGIDRRDGWDDLRRLLDTIRGCDHYIIHARKAWLDGLSPKQNREIPPLRHDVVYRLSAAYPQHSFSLNGGVQTLADVTSHLRQVDGVMMGRAACNQPAMLLRADQQIFNVPAQARSRSEVIAAYAAYMQDETAQGTPLHAMARHLLGLYQGMPGARRYRRELTLRMHDRATAPEQLLQAIPA